MSLKQKPVKPDDIHYWVNDRPPMSLAFLLAVQQIAFLGSIMTLPVVLGRAAGLDIAGEANLVALTMIAAGVGVILQALNRHGVGIGLFAPMHTSGVAFPAALAAVKMGGLGLAFGMMTIAGLVQVAASRAMPRLRAFFPVEIAGLTVFSLGFGLGLLGLKGILGVDTEWEGMPSSYGLGLFTLAIIITMNVWAKGMGQAFSVFIGLCIGQLLAWYMGMLPQHPLDEGAAIDFFAVPAIGQFGWSLDWRLLPDFIIVGIALSFNCFGVLTIAQRANDAAWRRPDMDGIGRGLMAEGLTNIFGSLINGVTQTASGGAVGLAQASGITSRVVAFVLGGLFILLAFFPPVAIIWSALSPAVIGAVLMFVGVFITLGGIKIMTSRLLDNRKIITLGVALVAGLGHDILLVNVLGLPSFFDSIFATSLSITVLVAVALNAVFRVGSKKKSEHNIKLDENWPEHVNRLIWHLGHEWGARPESVARLEHAANELVDVIKGQGLIAAPERIFISARFDEYSCTLMASYQGEGFELADHPPTPEQMMENPEAVSNMAGYLIRRLADNVKLQCTGGEIKVLMHFND